MVVRRRATRRKVPKRKPHIVTLGVGRYAVEGRNKAGILRKVSRIERTCPVSLGEPRIEKRKY